MKLIILTIMFLFAVFFTLVWEIVTFCNVVLFIKSDGAEPFPLRQAAILILHILLLGTVCYNIF